MPDSWGRRLVNHRLGAWTYDLPELTYLLASGSDRVGALDFQHSSTLYEPRGAGLPTLDDLSEASRQIEDGKPLNEHLNEVLMLGTSLGGARPKALVRDGARHLIAKFASTADGYPVEQGEYVAMTLASRCGLNAAAVTLSEAQNRPVLLVERFDRPNPGCRTRVVSALTILGLTVDEADRGASYSGLADAVRASFVRPDETLRELFGRISFNMLCGNTDDHGKNHAALIGPVGLELAPAFDVCPQRRSATEAVQAMPFGPAGERRANIAALITAASIYHLDEGEAEEIVGTQVAVIRDEWDAVCDEARLTASERASFFEHQFLNPAVLS
jgi:serine/threonine-protein kinase HipA